jgi:Tfp pilus assembly PilM family ATPase
LETGKICHWLQRSLKGSRLSSRALALAMPKSAANAEVRKVSLTDERTNLTLRGRVSERGVVFCLFAAAKNEDPGYPVVLPQPID